MIIKTTLIHAFKHIKHLARCLLYDQRLYIKLWYLVPWAVPELFRTISLLPQCLIYCIKNPKIAKCLQTKIIRNHRDQCEKQMQSYLQCIFKYLKTKITTKQLVCLLKYVCFILTWQQNGEEVMLHVPADGNERYQCFFALIKFFLQPFSSSFFLLFFKCTAWLEWYNTVKLKHTTTLLPIAKQNCTRN